MKPITTQPTLCLGCCQILSYRDEGGEVRTAIRCRGTQSTPARLGRDISVVIRRRREVRHRSSVSMNRSQSVDRWCATQGRVQGLGSKICLSALTRRVCRRVVTAITSNRKIHLWLTSLFEMCGRFIIELGFERNDWNRPERIRVSERTGQQLLRWGKCARQRKALFRLQADYAEDSSIRTGALCLLEAKEMVSRKSHWKEVMWTVFIANYLIGQCDYVTQPVMGRSNEILPLGSCFCSFVQVEGKHTGCGWMS